MTVCPTQVHPHQHLSEISRVHPSRLRTDRDQGIAFVVLARQQGTNLQRLDLRGQRGEVAPNLLEGALVCLFLGQVDHHGQVIDPRPQPLDPVHLGLCPRQPGGDSLGILLVIPQVRSSRLLLEVRDLAAAAGHIDYSLDRAQSPVETADLVEQVVS